MTVLAIDHVQLAMPPGGEDRATAFYEGILGLARVPKPAALAVRGGCWFESAACRVHLGGEADFVPARKAHPALVVDDLDTLLHRIADAGVASRDAEPVAGRRRAFVDDPFGNRIELVEHAEIAPPVEPAAQRQAVNLAARLGQFSDHWSPRTVALFNGHDVMVVKVQGEFTWHSHDDTDDLFLVLSGSLTIRLRDGDVELGAGELFVVPTGVEHQPYSAEGADVLIMEATGTPNTGDATTAAPRVVL